MCEGGADFVLIKRGHCVGEAVHDPGALADHQTAAHRQHQDGAETAQVRAQPVRIDRRVKGFWHDFGLPGKVTIDQRLMVK